MESIYDHGSHDIKMVIVGHKADLQDERAVTMDEGKKVWQSTRWSETVLSRNGRRTDLTFITVPDCKHIEGRAPDQVQSGEWSLQS